MFSFWLIKYQVFLAFMTKKQQNYSKTIPLSYIAPEEFFLLDQHYGGFY